jgi:hypothetical protein
VRFGVGQSVNNTAPMQTSDLSSVGQGCRAPPILRAVNEAQPAGAEENAGAAGAG